MKWNLSTKVGAEDLFTEFSKQDEFKNSVKKRYVFPIVSFVFALIFSLCYNYIFDASNVHGFYFPSYRIEKYLLILYVVPVVCFLLYFFFRKMNWRNVVIVLLILAYLILAFLVTRYGFHNIVHEYDSNLDEDFYVGAGEYYIYLCLSYAPFIVWAFVDFVIHIVANSLQKSLWLRNGIIILSLVMCVMFPYIIYSETVPEIFIACITGSLFLSILSVLILGGGKVKLSKVRLLLFIICVTIILSIPSTSIVSWVIAMLTSLLLLFLVPPLMIYFVVRLISTK